MNFKHHIYPLKATVERVASDLYRNSVGIALVCDAKQKLLGVLTLSDIKRSLLDGVDPHASISVVMNTHFVSAPKGTPTSTLSKLARQPTAYGTGLGHIPLIDKAGRVVGLYANSTKGKEQKTILITGGAGYIGSHLCRLLLAKGYQVVVLDKLLFGDSGIKDLYKNKDFELIEGDISNIGVLIKAVAKVDDVVHLAGIVGDPASALRPLQTMEENHFATQALINICKHYKIGRFIFASSCSVYGASKKQSHEKSSLNPVSLYAQSKVYSERELLKAAKEDFNPVILRFATVYGLSPRMRFDLVVNTMSAHAYFNKKINVHGGDQWRPLVHVEDVARACLVALEAPLQKVSSQIFNVGGSKENYQIKSIAEAVHAQVPQAAMNIVDAVDDRRDYHVSFDKIKKVLSYKPKHSLSESIASLVREFKRGKYKNWKDEKYSNYATLKSELEKYS